MDRLAPVQLVNCQAAGPAVRQRAPVGRPVWGHRLPGPEPVDRVRIGVISDDSSLPRLAEGDSVGELPWQLRAERRRVVDGEPIRG